MVLKDIIRLVRVKQWVKNGFVLMPLMFAGAYHDTSLIAQALLAMFVFSLIASSVYIFNDLVDRQKDREHPKKRHRAIASGRISVKMAIFLWVVLLVGGTGLATYLPVSCLIILIIYVIQNILYTAWLKHVAVLDVLLIAVGFVLRVLMGAYAIDVVASPWIILSTFMLALFLGFGKRRKEMDIGGIHTRAVLKEYTTPLLDGLLFISSTASVLAYAIYAVERSADIQNPGLVYTVVFVCLGIFRYLHAIYVKGEGDEPELMLIRDPLFVINGTAWLFLTIYFLT